MAPGTAKTAEIPAARREFIAALESMRGIAALAVLISHAFSVLAGRDWALLQRTVWNLETHDELVRRVVLAVFNGNAAVSLFFVLSGFVLALSLYGDERSPFAKAGAFAARRFLRIYPALVVNLVLMTALLWLLIRLFPSIPFDVQSVSDLGANLVLVDYKVNGPTWTMLVELLAIPLLIATHLFALKFGTRGVLIILVVCLIGLLLGGRVMGRFWSGESPFRTVVHAYLVDYQFMFVLGMLVAEWRARASLRIPAHVATAVLVVMVLLLLSARALFGFAARASFLIEGFASAAIVALLAAGPRIVAHTMLEWRPVRFLGRVSYSFYLYHATALAVVMPLVAFLMADAWREAQPYTSSIVITIAALVITVPLAWLSYVLVERPTMRIGRRF